jgi:hypothetical protein
MADLEGVNLDASNTAKDLFSGAMGGIAQVLLGQYFRSSLSARLMDFGWTCAPHVGC